jgi:hypothetical protein
VQCLLACDTGSQALAGESWVESHDFNPAIVDEMKLSCLFIEGKLYGIEVKMVGKPSLISHVSVVGKERS